MATRNLPGVYTSLNDMSQIPEGQLALTVGYVLKANKGPVNEATLVTSPTDFLAKYTFTGKPSISDDPTYWDILKVLGRTNQMYVVRAANEPYYGGASVATKRFLAPVFETNSETKQITINGIWDFVGGEIIAISSSNSFLRGNFTVASYRKDDAKDITVITVVENIPESIICGARVKETIVTTEMIGYEEVPVYKILMDGDMREALSGKTTLGIAGCSVEENNKDYHIVSVEYDADAQVTSVRVEEDLMEATDGDVWWILTQVSTIPIVPYTSGTQVIPDESAELFDILGVDPGEYNNRISIGIISSVDNPNALTYHKGADLGDYTCTFDTIQLNVYGDGSLLESFVFSKDPSAKTIDGESLYIDSVVTGSNYIQVVNNPSTTELPLSTVSPVALNGGSNGGDVTEETLVAALNAFSSKTVSVSILGNGSSAEAESDLYQQALLEIATTRKDLVVFLNSRKSDENATLPSVRATNIVNYKKNDLASVSFYGTMYAPHGKITDIYNNRQVKIGSSSTAIAGWLDIINTLNYPYAYAGPRNGQVSGMTFDWKIGDESGEAQLLNDASINYVAFDSKVGRYYMQCQNTLQVANSSLRNLGAVLNVLDIKEHFQTLLKEYLQLPITNSLRRDIVNTALDYLEPMNGIRFYNFAFQDVSSDMDIADNTLRYLLTLNLTAYAQRIYLVMNIVNNSFDFSILQSM